MKYLVVLSLLFLAGCPLGGANVCPRAQATAELICLTEPMIGVIIGDETGDFVGVADVENPTCVQVEDDIGRPVRFCK